MCEIPTCPSRVREAFAITSNRVFKLTGDVGLHKHNGNVE